MKIDIVTGQEILDPLNPEELEEFRAWLAEFKKSSPRFVLAGLSLRNKTVDLIEIPKECDSKDLQFAAKFRDEIPRLIVTLLAACERLARVENCPRCRAGRVFSCTSQEWIICSHCDGTYLAHKDADSALRSLGESV